MKIFKYSFFIILSAVMIFSCYEDRSKLADQGYNQIYVSFEEGDTVNAFLANPLIITPTVTSDEDTEITYSWEVGLYSRTVISGDTTITTIFEQVSDQKDLEYAHNTLGEFLLRFTATNEDGSTIKIFHFFVETEFEEGFLILGKNSDGVNTLAYQECLTGEDIGNSFKQNCYALVNNGEFLDGNITDMKRAYTSIYFLSEDQNKLIRVNAKSFVKQYDYSLDKLGEDFRCLEMVFADKITAVTLIYMPATTGGGGSLTVSTYEPVSSSYYPDTLFYTKCVYSEGPYAANRNYLFDSNGGITAPTSRYVVDYWADKEVINSFIYDWTNTYLTIISKDSDGVTKINKLGRYGYVYGNTSTLDISEDIILTENLDYITQDTKMYANNTYSCVFFNKDNNIYKWAFNQDQIPSTPFFTLPEGEEVQQISSFPLSHYLSYPANDESEVHIYTNNPSRDGLTGSLYRYNALTGELIVKHEGISDCPIKGIYKIK